MSNRNFDAHAIILRLQNKNIAQSNYAHQKSGKAIISNPQTSNGNASVIPYYTEGTGTTYQQSLESTYSVNVGGIYNLLQPTIPVIIPSGDVPPTPVITGAMSNRRSRQYFIMYTQPSSILPITNYSYSIDNGVTYTAMSPPVTTTASLLLTFPALGTYYVAIKAISGVVSSLPSNIWTVYVTF